MKTAYIVHPITPEQKQEIRKEGFKIIDARFAPEGEEVIDLNKADDTDAAGIPETPADIDKLKKDDLVALLKAHGAEDPQGKVPELRDALKQVMFTGV